MPFISNLKRPGCASKWDVLVLPTLRYAKKCQIQILLDQCFFQKLLEGERRIGHAFYHFILKPPFVTSNRCFYRNQYIKSTVKIEIQILHTQYLTLLLNRPRSQLVTPLLWSELWFCSKFKGHHGVRYSLLGTCQ